MAHGRRLSVRFWRRVSNELFHLNNFISLYRISYYATSSTKESVYIFGGFTNDSSTASRTSIIAEYKNGEWYNVGNLRQSRHAHGAITSGSLTMIIGGASADGQPSVFPSFIYVSSGWIFSLQTEIWEIETLENQIIAPTLPHYNYREVGLFLVDGGYCKKTWFFK